MSKFDCQEVHFTYDATELADVHPRDWPDIDDEKLHICSAPYDATEDMLAGGCPRKAFGIEGMKTSVEAVDASASRTPMDGLLEALDD